MSDDRTSSVRRSGRTRGLLVAGSAAASVALASTLALSAHYADQARTGVIGSGDGSPSTRGTGSGLVGSGTAGTSHAKSSGS
jgi:hypothetical protein